MRGRELMGGVGKTMMQSGGTFGTFMAIGMGIRCWEWPTISPYRRTAKLWDFSNNYTHSMQSAPCCSFYLQPSFVNKSSHLSNGSMCSTFHLIPSTWGVKLCIWLSLPSLEISHKDFSAQNIPRKVYHVQSVTFFKNPIKKRKFCCCISVDQIIAFASLTLWCCDIRLIQRVHDARVILAKWQVFYQMCHIYLQGRETHKFIFMTSHRKYNGQKYCDNFLWTAFKRGSPQNFTEEILWSVLYLMGMDEIPMAWDLEVIS